MLNPLRKPMPIYCLSKLAHSQERCRERAVLDLLLLVPVSSRLWGPFWGGWSQFRGPRSQFRGPQSQFRVASPSWVSPRPLQLCSISSSRAGKGPRARQWLRGLLSHSSQGWALQASVPCSRVAGGSCQLSPRALGAPVEGGSAIPFSHPQPLGGGTCYSTPSGFS